jgi:hypothetical protein
LDLDLVLGSAELDLLADLDPDDFELVSFFDELLLVELFDELLPDELPELLPDELFELLLDELFELLLDELPELLELVLISDSVSELSYLLFLKTKSSSDELL